MYAPSAFAEQDPDALAAFVDAHPFALVAVNGADGPVAAHAPMVLEEGADGASVLVGHLARANPFWRTADGAGALAVFSGADAYVSPSWCPSKARHGKVVPTWNYERVEARGVITVETDAAAVRGIVDRLTDVMERDRPTPWRTADAPDAYIDRLHAALVGVRLRVTSLEGVRKLSQNRSAADFDGVRSRMRETASPGAQATAAAMDELIATERG